MIDSVEKVSFNPLTCQKKQSELEKKHKKQQFISQMEGEFYCTYLIGETGKKTLISKIPMSQREKEDICLHGSAFEKIKTVISHNIKNSGATLESENQVTLETSSNVNTQESLELLKSYMGIPNSVQCKHKLQK